MNGYVYKCYMCEKDFELYEGEGWGESYFDGGMLPKTRFVCMKCINERRKNELDYEMEN